MDRNALSGMGSDPPTLRQLKCTSMIGMGVPDALRNALVHALQPCAMIS
jgi:hypothetical protein